jgi:hypothetical protein
MIRIKSKGGDKMSAKQESGKAGEASEPGKLGKRLEEIAWALFLIMTGALWLAPKAWAPEGTWLAGLGLILLGLNAARRLNGLNVQGFGIAVGAAALVAGIGRITGLKLPILAIFLIVLGAIMIIKTMFGREKRDDASSVSRGGR